MALIDTCPENKATCRGCGSFKIEDGKPHCTQRKRGSGSSKKSPEVGPEEFDKILGKLSEAEIVQLVRMVRPIVAYVEMVGYRIPVAMSGDAFSLGIYMTARVDLFFAQTGVERVENEDSPWFPVVRHMMRVHRKELTNEEALKFRVPMALESDEKEEKPSEGKVVNGNSNDTEGETS